MTLNAFLDNFVNKASDDADDEINDDEAKNEGDHCDVMVMIKLKLNMK